MKNPIVIAIDGPASSGKGTIAKKLSIELGYVYLDTGAMYRALTFFCLENNIEVENEQAVIDAANLAEIDFDINGKTMLNGVDVTQKIRTPEVNALVSAVISLYAGVREIMVQKQRIYGENNNIVVDGRDVGTVIFPSAAVKLFISASLRERAMRRAQQNKENGLPGTFAENIELLALRDFTDMNRKVSPLRIAENAIVVDSTTMTVEQTLQNVITLVKRKVETI
ncbi:cytidylate kinase [Erysipelotrichaceae bacterium]|nr:cytidylate kinase [Erysipelotrichaceae bacterium]